MQFLDALVMWLLSSCSQQRCHKLSNFYPREHAMLARVYILLFVVVVVGGGGGGCFTQLLRISSWLYVE
jgi:hypothetical protein